MTRQKKTSVAVIGGAIIIAIAFYAMYSGQKSVPPGPEPAPEYPTIVSQDGSAQMAVPEGALPEGTTVDDLSIEIIEYDESDEETTEGLLSYSLRPDGLQLAAPVTVTLTTDLSPGDEYDIPLVLHVSGEGEDAVTEIIDNTLVTVDPEAGDLVVAADVTHFSDIHLYNFSGLFVAKPDSVETSHQLDVLFEATQNIRPSKKTVTINHPSRDVRGRYVGRRKDVLEFAPGTTWGIEGFLETDYALYILPQYKEILDRRGLTIHQSYKARANFTCKKAGDEGIQGGVNHDKWLSVTFTALHKHYYTFESKPFGEPDISKPELSINIRVPEKHTCIGPPEEEDEDDEVVQPEMMMEYIGPPYFIDCGHGQVLTGNYRYDENQELITDAEGNGLDKVTGLPVICK
ncbi:MAG: hypothetical protein U9Q03_00345 [Patescibacteria group bacterium]|nr:hypothetical protein [Patescibacteria group bacterium]